MSVRFVLLTETYSVWNTFRAMMTRVLTFLFALSTAFSQSDHSQETSVIYSQDNSEWIVLRFKDMVYRIALMRMKDRYLAEDIFRETFLRLIQKKRRFESETMLKAWLIRVTINRCNDYYRSAMYRKSVIYIDETIKDDDGSDEDADPALCEDSYDPFDTDNPLAEITYEAIMSLSVNYREVIHLFYYEEMTVKSIALVLGIQENAVKTRLSRARNILRDKLKGVYHGE